MSLIIFVAKMDLLMEHGLSMKSGLKFNDLEV